jgi:hypothetical protein
MNQKFPTGYGTLNSVKGTSREERVFIPHPRTVFRKKNALITRFSVHIHNFFLSVFFFLSMLFPLYLMLCLYVKAFLRPARFRTCYCRNSYIFACISCCSHLISQYQLRTLSLTVLNRWIMLLQVELAYLHFCFSLRCRCGCISRPWMSCCENTTGFYEPIYTSICWLSLWIYVWNK